MEQNDRLDIRVPKSLKKALEAMADADRRKLSDYIRVVLEDHVKAKGKSDRKKEA